MGAMGYVGRYVCRALERRGHAVVPFGRAESDALLARVPRGAERKGRAELGFEAVVNLAHPGRGPAHAWPAENRRIFRAVTAIAGAGARIVQVGTLAVFGRDLELAQRPAPVAWRRTFPYVECKLELEDWLLREGRPLDVVRLGHVWGPASPAWTARLVRLLEAGEPTGIEGSDGFANATDVENVASYIAFLLDEPASHEARFHHLAELGGTRWSSWVDGLAAELGTSPRRIATLPPGPDAASPVARLLLGERSGSLVRSAVRRLPAPLTALVRRFRPRLSPLPPTAPRADAALLRHLSCARRFEPHELPGWRPALTAEESWAAVASWLRESRRRSS